MHTTSYSTSWKPILAMSLIHVSGLGKSGERSTGTSRIRHGYCDGISILERESEGRS